MHWQYYVENRVGNIIYNPNLVTQGCDNSALNLNHEQFIMSQDDQRFQQYPQQYAQPMYVMQPPYGYPQNQPQYQQPQYPGYNYGYQQGYPQQYQWPYPQYPPKKPSFRPRTNEADVTDPAPTIEELRLLYAPLRDVNKPTFEPTAFQHAHFVIIRSATIDNVHKGMKHGVWTSTSRSNQKLHNLYLQATANKQEVFLLYTVVGSQAFQGVARLMSPFDPKYSFLYWDEPHKWFGTFQVQWYYVNEVSQAYLDEQVQVHKVQHQPWTDQGDCTQIQPEQGVFIMRCFKQRNDVLDNRMLAKFPYLNKRETEIRTNRDGDQEFLVEQTAQEEQFQLSPFEYKQHNKKKHRNMGQHYYPPQEFYGYPQQQQYPVHQQQFHQQQMPQQQSYEDQSQTYEDRFAVKQKQQRKVLVNNKQKKKLSKASHPLDYQQDPNAIIPRVEDSDSERE